MGCCTRRNHKQRDNRSEKRDKRQSAMMELVIYKLF